jgi:starch phosphorylase
MPFHIQPLREFLVRPSLPGSLSRLTELAYNIVWSWEPIIRSVFRRLDPVMWRDSGYNPVLMLGRVSQATCRRPPPIRATCALSFCLPHLRCARARACAS